MLALKNSLKEPRPVHPCVPSFLGLSVVANNSLNEVKLQILFPFIFVIAQIQAHLSMSLVLLILPHTSLISGTFLAGVSGIMTGNLGTMFPPVLCLKEHVQFFYTEYFYSGFFFYIDRLENILGGEGGYRDWFFIRLLTRDLPSGLFSMLR